MSMVTPTAMIAPWPALSSDSEVWLRTAAFSPGGQRFIVAPCLVAFVTEVFDGLVVKQAVNRAGIRLGVHLVHGAAEDHAPFRHPQREDDVHHQRRERDDSEPRVVLDEQDAGDETDFEQRRQDIEQHEVEQEADTGGAAFDVARHAAGLAVEVEAQRERVQVSENF